MPCSFTINNYFNQQTRIKLLTRFLIIVSPKKMIDEYFIKFTPFFHLRTKLQHPAKKSNMLDYFVFFSTILCRTTVKVFPKFPSSHGICKELLSE